MKKISIKAMACIMALSMGMTSCIGSFGLFNKLLAWNNTISDKFINEVIFVLISPAYAICGTVDVLVLNSIEFWTGDNPVADAGKTKNIMGNDGVMYAVKTTKKGYEITSPEGKTVSFVFDKKNKSWSSDADGNMKELFRFNDDGTIQAVLPNGETMNVALNKEGVNQLRMEVYDGLFYATR